MADVAVDIFEWSRFASGVKRMGQYRYACVPRIGDYTWT